MNKINSVILLSGNGSNFKNILDKIKNGYINMNITAVISNNKNAYGLERAKKENIETFILNNKINDELDSILKKMNIDLIILAGYMKILPPKIVNKF